MRPLVALLLATSLHAGAAKAANRSLEQAASAYAELDYARVLPLVEQALAEPLSMADAIRAYELRAFVHTIEGREPEARDAFLTILELDPGYDLAPNVSPKLRGPLELARATFVPTPAEPVLEAPPVAKPPDIAQPAATTARRVEGPRVWSRPWFWAAAAAVVATAVVLVVVASSGDELPDHDYGPFRVNGAGGIRDPW